VLNEEGNDLEDLRALDAALALLWNEELTLAAYYVWLADQAEYVANQSPCIATIK
jgi:hypothetical protein